MKNFQTIMDTVAIGLSVICAIHCVLLPIAITLLPVLVTIPFAGEVFRQFLLIGVVPISIIALTIGCEKHRKWNNVLLGIVGLILLVFSTFLGHYFAGEIGEECIILIGVALIFVSHIRNYNLSKLNQWEYS